MDDIETDKNLYEAGKWFRTYKSLTCNYLRQTISLNDLSVVQRYIDN